MNFDEKKFITVDGDSNLQLLYLPYTLKCECLLIKKDKLDFKVMMIAFSQNEKLVIVGNDWNLAVAVIEGIKNFYLRCRKINERCTVIKFREECIKIISLLVATLILFDFVGCIQFGEILFRSKIQRTGWNRELYIFEGRFWRNNSIKVKIG